MKTDPQELLLFPVDLAPLSADTIAQYTFIIGRLAPFGYDANLATAHDRALGLNEPLATMLRSVAALADVGAAAAAVASPLDLVPISEVRSRASAAAVATYKRTIAEQLAARADHPLQRPAREYLAARDKREQAERRQAERDEARLAEEARLEEARRAEALAAQAAADAAALAAEQERALLDLQASNEAERVRVRVVTELQFRLRRTSVHQIRLGDGFYSPHRLADAVGSWGVESCRSALDALTRAEGAR